MELHWRKRGLNHLYIMCMKCLDDLFGQKLQGLRVSKKWILKTQEMSFMANLGLRVYERFKGLVNSCYGLQMSSIFIEKRLRARADQVVNLKSYGLVKMEQPSFGENYCSNTYYKRDLKWLGALDMLLLALVIGYDQRKQCMVSRS